MATRQMNRNRKRQNFRSGGQVSRNDEEAVLARMDKLTLGDCLPVVLIPPEVKRNQEKWEASLMPTWEKVKLNLDESKIQIKNEIQRYFFDYTEPYWQLLSIFEFWDSFYEDQFSKSETEVLKMDIYNLIMDVFEKIKINSAPSQDVAIAFFRMINDLDLFKCIKRVNAIFKYDSNVLLKRCVVDEVKELVIQEKYTLAAKWVTILNLQSNFKHSHILLPLMLNNQLQAVKDYLKGEDIKRQKAFVYLLNELCRSGKVLLQAIEELDLKDVKLKKPRQLQQPARQLAKMYDIPLKQLAHLQRWQMMDTLGFLIRAQYKKSKFHPDDWEHFVFDFVGKDYYLKHEAIQMAMIYKDLGRAIKWTRHWNVALSKLDNKLVAAIESKQEYPLKEFPAISDDVDYYKPQLPQICWVENNSQFQDCIQHLRQSEKVGLDSEWKSHFKSSDVDCSPKTAVMQIATSNRIFLLDMLKLKSVLNLTHWMQFHTQLFANPSLTKLAFSFTDDWEGLVAICPQAFTNHYQSPHFIDLRELFDKVLELHPAVFPHFDSADENLKRGLSRLMELCFNQPLDKREQISNWEKRPLRASQVTYAAVDAFCLLKIHHVIEQRCRLLNIDYQKLLDASRQPKPTE